MVVVPDTVKLPSNVTLAPLNVIAAVGVEPDLITSSPLLLVIEPKVVPPSFNTTSAPSASRVMSPAESSVIVEPVMFVITGSVSVLFVSVAVYDVETNLALPPVLGKVKVFDALSECGAAIIICPCEFASQFNCIAP